MKFEVVGIVIVTVCSVCKIRRIQINQRRRFVGELLEQFSGVFVFNAHISEALDDL